MKSKTMTNAIIMASGLGTRMLPLTRNIPKPLLKVKGVPMIESIIEALIKSGVSDKIYVVTGYLKEQFEYLKEKYSVEIINNPDYREVNNISSIFHAKDILKQADCLVFEADLFISDYSIFNFEKDFSFYFGKFIKGESEDWVFDTDEDGFISRIGRGGCDCYNMAGVSFIKKEDGEIIADEIEKIYGKKGFEALFWDEVVNQNLDKLKLKIRPVEAGKIQEIDTIYELKMINGEEK